MDEDQEFGWGRNFVEYFSNKYDCSGMCKLPLFEWEEIIPADNTCKYELRDELKLNFEFLGILLIISSGASMGAFCIQYYMWRDYRIQYNPLQMHYEQ